MAENPLLPDAQLRVLYKTLQYASASDSTGTRTRARRSSSVASALWAAPLVQLHTSDLFLTSAEDPAISRPTSDADKSSRRGIPSIQSFPSGSPHWLLAAGLAAAQRRAGEGLSLALNRTASSNPGWREALAWAQEELLPLILLVADRSGNDAFRPATASSKEELNWGHMQRAATKLKVPVLSVDGEDAVATYRVVQESILRARARGGPTVLWAILPAPGGPTARRTVASSPLDRLAQYMKVRGIALPA